MRITGGIYCRRQIKCPKGVIRPAMDRMRESMFSILGNISGVKFLDLFCGSGIVGIEAASRGAAKVCFVEMDRKKKGILLENSSIAENTDREVYIMPAEKFIKMTKEKFDIVFLDPPFPLKGKQKLLELASEFNIVDEDGIVMIHHPSEEKWPDTVGRYHLFDRRKYGRSILLFFRNISDSARTLSSKDDSL